ncbi:MAG: hypothetical protein ACLTX6_10745 [Lachnospiraceae bacterium]
MKKRILILLGILIIGGAAGGVCWKTGIIQAGAGKRRNRLCYRDQPDLPETLRESQTGMPALLNRRKTEEVELENGT